MKNFVSIFSLILFSIVISTNTSCSDRYAIENAKLDTLELHLEAAEKFLNIDIALIKARVNEIEINRTFIRNEYKDTFSMELGSNLDRYKALMRIYESNIEQYNKWTSEYDELSEQVANLRKALKRDELEREQFKQYYYTEEKDIIALREGSKMLQKSMYEMEPEYNRLTAYFDPIIEELAKED